MPMQPRPIRETVRSPSLMLRIVVRPFRWWYESGSVGQNRKAGLVGVLGRGAGEAAVVGADEDGHDQGGEQHDRGGPPGRGPEAVHGCLGWVAAGVGGKPGGRAAGGDGVQQRGADGAADLLGVLTIAEATPASCGRMPEVASVMAGMNAAPMPIPSSTVAGMTSAQ